MIPEFTAPRKLQPSDKIEGFSCGVEKIDKWIVKYAMKAEKRGTAVVYGTFAATGESRCAGIYSLSAHSMDRGSLTGWLARNAPDQIPVILLGMLAVDSRYAGNGLGTQLLLDAYKRARAASNVIGAKALVVDPLDDSVVPFYEQYGFRKIPGSDRLYAKFS